MNEPLRIDGRQGEGGGQVVRTALALSVITGRPFVLEHVRARRANPGLRRQHLTAVTAASAICGGRADGDQLHSDRLSFEPGPLATGSYSFSIGTAGSTTLVLQTVLPALLLADGPSTVRLTGGTHNPLAPSFDFLDRVFLPALRAMGVEVAVKLARYGFFPAGGGEMDVTIRPTKSMRRIRLLETGKLLERKVEAIVANLPEHVARREVDTIVRRSQWGKVSQSCRGVAAAGPGNVAMIELRYEHASQLFTALGRRGVPAEKVAAECLKEAKAFLRRPVPVGVHLADQLLLPAAIAAHYFGQRSEFRTCPLSDHGQTQIDLIPRFLDVRFDQDDSQQGLVISVSPFD